jgi:hypothetical protein
VSNAAIVKRMHEACDQWDAGTIDNFSLGEQLVGHAEALEGVPRRIVEEARAWQQELEVASEPAYCGQRDVAVAQVNTVVGKIRAWVEKMNSLASKLGH